MKYADNKKKLEVRVNLWNQNPGPDGESSIKGCVVHPANKSDDIRFKDVYALMTILKEFKKADKEWFEPCNVIKSEHVG